MPALRVQISQVFCFAVCFPRNVLAELEVALLEELPPGAVVYVSPIHVWGQARVRGRRFELVEGGAFLAVAEPEREL